MKKLFLFVLAAILSVPAQAHIPGLQSGFNASRALLGTPTPGLPPVVGDLTPGPTPFSTTYYANWAQTATPGQQGSGDTTNVILGWEMPPYAPITSANPEICAMAFHAPNATEYAGGTKNAVAKVRFIANNGSPVDVTTPTESSRSPNRDMYCTDLNLAGVPDNTVVEIRIIGYPTNGMPVVMQGNYDAPFWSRQYSLPVVANWNPTTYYLAAGTGSDANPCTSGSPCLTLNRIMTMVGNVDVSHVRVCLAPGTYGMSSSVIRSASRGWFTIQSCGTGNKSNVFINSVASSTSSGGANRVRYSGVTFNLDYTPSSNTTLFNLVSGSGLWLDNMEIDGGNCFDTTNCYLVSSGNLTGRGIYLTEVNVESVNNNPANAVLFRNVTLDHYNADYAQNVKVIINGTIVSKPQSDWCCSVHPDLNQISTEYGGYTHIVNGFQTLSPIDSAGLFSSSGTPTQIGGCWDCAYVDVQFDNTENPTRAGWQWDGNNPHHNVFFLRLNMKTGNISNDPPDRANWTIVDSVCKNAADADYAIGPASGFTYRGSPSCD